jgi:hypothetical protein
VHTGRNRAAVAALIAVGLTGCTHSTPSAPPSGPASPRSSPSAVEAIDGGAGSYYVLIERADPVRSSLTVDVVQFFSGAAAARECARDGVPDQRGALCHDYYIRDRSSRLWTVPVGRGAALVVRGGGCGPARPTTLRGVAAELGRHRLFRLHLTRGVGTGLDEACTP